MAKDVFITAIVRKSRDGCGIATQRQNSRMFVIRTCNILTEVRREVNRHRRTATISRRKNLLVGSIAVRNELRRCTQGFKIEVCENLRKVSVIGSDFVWHGR